MSAAVVALLHREALLLDARRWDEWLDLYADDCVFWVPAWRDEDTPTSDPDRELSLIYYDSRQGLIDRIGRLRAGQSIASSPLRRTAHAIGAAAAEEEGEGATAQTSWSCHVYDPRRRTQHVYFGRASYVLRRRGAAWTIARKTVVVMNDVIPAVLDVYMI